MRWALGVSYDGSRYFGWQQQALDKLPTIQALVQRALSQVAASPIEVICAGRTDAGVHALGQVIHFDTEVSRDERAWLLGTNRYLPTDIRITWAQQTSETFHARFSALARRYQYVIYNSPVPSALYPKQVAWYAKSLDENRMQQAAQYLLGEHDFSAFRAKECQAKSPIRTVYHLHIMRHGKFIILDIKANAFLHHMVRNIVGILMAIGVGKHELGWANQVLTGRDRSLGGVTASAAGLYLMEVSYPEQFLFPHFAKAQPFFID